MMHALRSLLFSLLICLWGAIIPIIYCRAIFTRNTKLADHGAKVWSQGSLWMLKKICGIDHEIIGLEKLPPEACIIACKHQSMWETIVMHLIFYHPVYAYKKELEKIPFYGWFVKVMSGISVNRSGGTSAIKSLIKQTKSYLEKDQNIILFPQGTRVPVGGSVQNYPYQSGVTALYLSCKVKVVPVALNSGKCWPKYQAGKKPGKITLEFLDPIEPGLPKREFNQSLEDAIETRSRELSEI